MNLFLQEFTARPDIADDCFLLASRCIRYCPELFIPSEVFQPLVDCSMIGITVQHKYSLYLSISLPKLCSVTVTHFYFMVVLPFSSPCRQASNSILAFLSDVFDLAKSSKGEQYLPIRDSVIIPRGASITRILIASLTGALPSFQLEPVAPSFTLNLL